MAVDAFVGALLEQRCDAASLAAEIRWALLLHLASGARYARSLASAARAHPDMPAAVADALCMIVDIGAAGAPRDTAALLALLLDLRLEHRLTLPAAARDCVASLRLTGKAKAAQKELLARAW
jgi:hypothetical protein